MAGPTSLAGKQQQCRTHEARNAIAGSSDSTATATRLTGPTADKYATATATIDAETPAANPNGPATANSNGPTAANSNGPTTKSNGPTTANSTADFTVATTITSITTTDLYAAAIDNATGPTNAHAGAHAGYNGPAANYEPTKYYESAAR